MAKVTIIEVDLGEEVQSIISEELTAISEGTQKQLDVMRESAQLTARVRDEKLAKNRLLKDADASTLKTAFDLILSAGNVGMPASEVMKAVHPLITNPSAFTLRMKTYLRKAGNTHALIREKNNYILLPYNTSDQS